MKKVLMQSINGFSFNIIIFVFLLMVISTSPNFAHDQNIHFKHLSSDDGLSHSNVICTLQDDQGFMWFGTFDGLNKYDSYHFTVYRHNYKDSNSIASNIIRSMYKDSQGNLWIGTTEGLCLYDRDRDAFINYNRRNGYNLDNFDI